MFSATARPNASQVMGLPSMIRKAMGSKPSG